MESQYAIFITPEPLTDRGPIGYVLADGWLHAHHRAAAAIKIGFEISLLPRWALDERERNHG